MQEVLRGNKKAGILPELRYGAEDSRAFDRPQKQGPGLLQWPEKSLDLQLHYHSIIITNTRADNQAKYCSIGS